MNTSLMYYTGDNHELADEAECIEIVDVELWFKDNGTRPIIRPIWGITPEKPDSVDVEGYYVGTCDELKYFVCASIRGFIVTTVSSTNNELKCKVRSTWIASASVGGPDDAIETKAVRRGVAMGLFSSGRPAT